MLVRIYLGNFYKGKIIILQTDESASNIAHILNCRIELETNEIGHSFVRSLALLELLMILSAT